MGQTAFSAKEIAAREQLRDDFDYYAVNCLFLKTKEGDVQPFRMNRAQLHIHKVLEAQLSKTGKIRALILKGRQQGVSTYVEGRFYWRVTSRLGVRAFILTHLDDATQNLFEMAERYHFNAPAHVRPVTGKTNAKELVFSGLDSGFKVGTAGNKSVGRSSTIQYFHGSEVGYWPHADSHARGVMQAIPDADGTEVILESTANGIGNYFHQQWQLAESGESEYIAVFVPWFWQEEYQKTVPDGFGLTADERTLKELYHLTNEQLVWRRDKVAELSANGTDGLKSFKQEYPCTAAEAFQTSGDDGLIKPDDVMKARTCDTDAHGPLVIGVDPARFGPDRSAIIRRKGRVAYDLETHSKKDTMELVGIIGRIIRAERPERIFVDVGGLGAGVVDRLREMYGRELIRPVNSGEKALDPDRYVNKRAEMWGEMNEWLCDRPVSIPDKDELHADLCGPLYSFDSKTRLVIERKKDMKKRGLRSSDCADALAVTFAEPVAPVEDDNHDDDSGGEGGWMG